jgi:hypothetical protein
VEPINRLLIHNNEKFIVNNEFATEVEKGLNDKQKHISPKFFMTKMAQDYLKKYASNLNIILIVLNQYY